MFSVCLWAAPSSSFCIFRPRICFQARLFLMHRWHRVFNRVDPDFLQAPSKATSNQRNCMWGDWSACRNWDSHMHICTFADGGEPLVLALFCKNTVGIYLLKLCISGNSAISFGACFQVKLRITTAGKDTFLCILCSLLASLFDWEWCQ